MRGKSSIHKFKLRNLEQNEKVLNDIQRCRICEMEELVCIV